MLSPPTHITPVNQPGTYDTRAQQAAVPVLIHYEDGGAVESVLVCTADEIERVRAETTRLAQEHEAAGEVPR
ncbi:hypothetical protein [Streptomyces iconiensis]|uniref:Uncharacterized protein n=1 Tax=Streptomyces iconiensis TaxID=1384038 RepID=A0ABT7A4I9_9ACTN|nr:hypothetical protein [Streptomyces iconiensis]MDJ1136201.1 hypothetical protein [Streptomyces iconiensis]